MATGGGLGSGPPKDDKTRGQNVINNFVINIGEASGNTFNFFFDLPVKLKGSPELMDVIKSKVDARGGNVSLEEITDSCDASVLRVERGCVQVTLRIRSAEGFEKLLEMYSSGKLEERLKTDLPVTKVQIPEEAIERGRIHFARIKELETKLQEKLTIFERAALRYVKCRQDTVGLLRELVKDINSQHRKARIAAVAGTSVAAAAGLALALVTLGASLPLSAGAVAGAGGAGALAVLGALVVQAVNAKISTNEAKKILGEDKEACVRIDNALKQLDRELQEVKKVIQGILVASIYDLVGVTQISVQDEALVLDTVGGLAKRPVVNFVFFAVPFVFIITHVVDTFSKDVPKMAQKLSELADHLKCPTETEMMDLVSSVRVQLKLP